MEDLKTVILIKANGETSKHQFQRLTISNIKKLVDYDIFDCVNLRDGRVMMVDDISHTREVKPPINEEATRLYHSVCVLGTTWPILGDVIVTNDADWQVPNENEFL